MKYLQTDQDFSSSYPLFAHFLSNNFFLACSLLKNSLMKIGVELSDPYRSLPSQYILWFWEVYVRPQHAFFSHYSLLVSHSSLTKQDWNHVCLTQGFEICSKKSSVLFPLNCCVWEMRIPARVVIVSASKTCVSRTGVWTSYSWKFLLAAFILFYFGLVTCLGDQVTAQSWLLILIYFISGRWRHKDCSLGKHLSMWFSLSLLQNKTNFLNRM